MPFQILSLPKWKLGEKNIEWCGCLYRHGYCFVKLKILLGTSRIPNLLGTPLQNNKDNDGESHLIELYLSFLTCVIKHFCLFVFLTTMIYTAIFSSDVNIWCS